MTRRSYRSLARRSAVSADIAPGYLRIRKRTKRERKRVARSECDGNRWAQPCYFCRYRRGTDKRSEFFFFFFLLLWLKVFIHNTRTRARRRRLFFFFFYSLSPFLSSSCCFCCCCCRCCFCCCWWLFAPLFLFFSLLSLAVDHQQQPFLPPSSLFFFFFFFFLFILPLHLLLMPLPAAGLADFLGVGADQLVQLPPPPRGSIPLPPRRLERRRSLPGDGGEEPLSELAGFQPHRRVETLRERRGFERERHAGAHDSLESGGD